MQRFQDEVGRIEQRLEKLEGKIELSGKKPVGDVIYGYERKCLL